MPSLENLYDELSKYIPKEDLDITTGWIAISLYNIDFHNKLIGKIEFDFIAECYYNDSNTINVRIAYDINEIQKGKTFSNVGIRTIEKYNDNTWYNNMINIIKEKIDIFMKDLDNCFTYSELHKLIYEDKKWW